MHDDAHVEPAKDEAHERDLNRHRGDEQRRAREEVIARLDDRGIVVEVSDSTDDIVEMLEAVEAFEHAVEARGGDLMVDSYPAPEPDNQQFVLPMRADNESLERYTDRVRRARERIGGAQSD